MIEKLFKVSAAGSTIPREILAGITTFLTLAYIVIVNPSILKDSGMDFGSVFVATILAAALSTLIMGLFANYPIAIAPGMGMNAYFAYSVVQEGTVSWQMALGAVFVAGVIFIALTFTAFRETLIAAIPDSLKYGITAGIGLFIAFIGLKSAGFIVDNPVNLVQLGNFHDPKTLLSLVGLLITLILIALNVRGALFIGMVIITIVAAFTGMFQLPSSIVDLPPSMAHTFLQMDIASVFTEGLYAVVFAFLLVTIFDTTGTMIGVAEQAGLMKNGHMPRAKSALFADAVGMSAGAAFGTSPTSAYIESSAGVQAGGRTGLTAVVVALLLLITLFFSPIVSAIALIPAVTAPTLIIVGCFMMHGLAKVKWGEFDEAFPAFIIMLSMPLTFSIATGIALGFITYPILKVVRGKYKEVHPLVYIFGILFAIQIGFFPE